MLSPDASAVAARLLHESLTATELQTALSLDATRVAAALGEALAAGAIMVAGMSSEFRPLDVGQADEPMYIPV